MTNQAILTTPNGEKYFLIGKRAVRQLITGRILSNYRMFIGTVCVGTLQAESHTVAARIARDVLSDDTATVEPVGIWYV